LLVGDVPEAEPLAGCLQERTGAPDDFLIRRLAQVVAGTEGQQILLLGGDQLGTVEREEWLPLLHLLPGVVSVDYSNPAPHLGVNMGDAGLIDLHDADGTDGTGKVFNFDLSRADTDELLPFGRDSHGTRRHVCQGGCLVGILRDKLHAAVRRNAGLVGLVVGVHGVVPEENLRLIPARWGCTRLVVTGALIGPRLDRLCRATPAALHPVNDGVTIADSQGRDYNHGQQEEKKLGSR
jgi:hypothetical protein